MPSFKNKLNAALGLTSLAGPYAAAKQSSVSILNAAKGALGGPSTAGVTMSDIGPVRAASAGAVGAVATVGLLGAMAINGASKEATAGATRDNENSANPSVLLGKGKTMRKQTSRRIMRAMGDLSM